MDFELTGEQRSLQQMVREFATSELKPGAGQRDETGKFPRPQVNKLQGMGLFGLPFPVEYGGGGRDFISFVLAIEELARVDASLTITILAHTLCTSHINAFGSAEQKREHLLPLASGKKLGAWALTEPGGGVTPATSEPRPLPRAAYGDSRATSSSSPTAHWLTPL